MMNFPPNQPPRSSRLPLSLAACAVLASCASPISPDTAATAGGLPGNIRKIRTYDSPGRSSEVLSYSKPLQLLLATNSAQKDVQVYRLPSPASANPVPVDMDSTARGYQGLSLGGEPTSIAVHPSRAIAFAAVNGGGGRLVILDLKAAARGEKKILLDQKIGIHLDSIAVSPDGRWVIVADEAEGSASTPGNILIAPIGQAILHKPLPFRKAAGLVEAIGQAPGVIEPEFVAVSPSSKFAAVSCQDNDAIAIVSLSQTPRVIHTIRLPRNSSPDGIHIAYQSGKLILGIAEEAADSASFYQLANSGVGSQLISRINVRTLAGQGSRSDPEGMVLFTQSGRHYAAIGVERANRVLIMDMVNPAQPRKAGVIGVGSRPEDIIALKSGSTTTIISADEGKPGRGEISFITVK